MFYQYLKNWLNRYFSNEETIFVFIALVAIFSGIYFYSNILMPVLVAATLSFILVVPIHWLERIGVPSTLACTIIIGAFVSILVLAFVYLIPIVSFELNNLLTTFPVYFQITQQWLMRFYESNPVIPPDAIVGLANELKTMTINFGKDSIASSLQGLGSVASFAMYFIIVPILTFFILQDRFVLLEQISRIIPQRNTLLSEVYTDMRQMMSIYLTNKLIEIVIVSIASWLVLALFDLPYALLIGLLTGVLVMVPYVGAVIAFVPLIIIGIAHWGFNPMLLYCLLAYSAIQIIDSYVIVPLLFSETLNIRPFWALLALIIFGGIWGVWGVILAIPIATFIKVIIKLWPVADNADT